MGLQNQAFLAMLANPRFAPFQHAKGYPNDWILIDHLIFIYKLSTSLYVKTDSTRTISNMAQSLASQYISHAKHYGHLVLVKDGEKAPKPAVRRRREMKKPSEHIAFCLRNLAVIEYEMMLMLMNAGLKEKVFLVTGATLDHEAGANCSMANIISLKERTLASDTETSETHGENKESCESLCPDGGIERPHGFTGVFLATFAHTDSPSTSSMIKACKQCTNTEADELLVELANLLDGTVTINSEDTDLLAVLTGSGRKGITLRLDYRYSIGKSMHGQRFFQLMLGEDENIGDLSLATELSSSDKRFQVLCDISEGEELFVQEDKQRHALFEMLLQNLHISGLEIDIAKFLYRSGIRGSVYRTFLLNFLSQESKIALNQLLLVVNSNKRIQRRYIFELVLSTDFGKNPSNPSKRKRGEHENDAMTYLLHAYTNGVIPRGSHGHYLKLQLQSTYTRCYYLCVKDSIIENDKLRMEKLYFMALCGTDYNVIPYGLGIKRLLSAVSFDKDVYSKWCQDMTSNLWGNSDDSHKDHCKMALRLANMSGVPLKTSIKHWTTFDCKVMCKSLKYVCDLWMLKRPKPCPEYGMDIKDDKVIFTKREKSNAFDFLTFSS